MINPEKLYKTKEVAEILNMNQQVVVRKLRDGTMNWIKFNHTWRIKWENLNKYIWFIEEIKVWLENGIEND